MKYKQNLRVEGNKIFSYNTHVADIEPDKVVRFGYWSMTTSKHINYVARMRNLPVVESTKGGKA